jgi:hypothetical protein
VARKEENRVEFSVLVGKPEGRRQLGTHSCRWMDNIKVNLRGTSLGGGVFWFDLTQYSNKWWAVVKRTMNLRFP